MLVGKEVLFSVEYKTNTGREYGSVWVSVVGQLHNVTDLIVSEGLVEVRQAGVRRTEGVGNEEGWEAGVKKTGRRRRAFTLMLFRAHSQILVYSNHRNNK